MVTFAGIVLIVMLLTNRPVNRMLVRIGHRQARRRLLPYLDEEVTELYNVAGDYVVGSVRLAADPGPSVRSLRTLDAALGRVKVLGVRHGEEYFGMPPVDVELHEGDELVVYGRRGDVERVESR